MKPPERETLKLLRLNPVTDTQRPLKELHHLFQGLKCRQGGKKRERESGSIPRCHRDPAIGVASPRSRCVSPKNGELAGKWRFLSRMQGGGDAGCRNAQGGILEAGRDVMGEGLDPAPQHPNLMTLIPKEGASRSFQSPSRSIQMG